MFHACSRNSRTNQGRDYTVKSNDYGTVFRTSTEYSLIIAWKVKRNKVHPYMLRRGENNLLTSNLNRLSLLRWTREYFDGQYICQFSLEAINFIAPCRRWKCRCTYWLCDAAILASAGYATTFGCRWRAGTRSI
jgi:hypothetical protein